MFSDKDHKQRQIDSAQVELTEIEAMLILLSNNDLACEIHIAGMNIGICNNKKVIPALKDHKKQIENFLLGEKNNWE